MSDAPTEMEVRVADVIGLAMTDAVLSGDCGREKIYSAARAAIRAMREPTREMILAGEDAYSCFEDSGRDTNGNYDFVRKGHEAPTFNAMIDAASPIRPEDTASLPVGLPRENKGVGE